MKREQKGFAVLMVFMLAASVCIYLYMQMPRVAFEAQRAREDLLIQRGEQYKRAIQLYVRKTGGRYPGTIDDLENTNGIRFLRRRYKDPMTGKDEWRLIHVGPGGVLTDSVVTKPQGAKDEKKSENNFISEGPAMTGSGPQTTGTGANLALRQRPSDRPGAPGSSPASGPGTPPPGTDPNIAYQPNPPGQYGQPAQYGQPYQPGQPANPFQQPGQPQYGQPGQQPQYPGQPGQPQYGQPGQQPQYPGQPYQPYQPGQPANPFQQPGQPQPGQPGQQPQYPSQPGQPPPVPYQPGQVVIPGTPGTPGAPNPGLKMMQDILTKPRPGGFPGTATTGSQTIGGGIAGVASKFEGDSIKIYGDRQKYEEWEFIYDIKQDMQKQVPGNPQGQNPLDGKPQTPTMPANPTRPR